MATCQFHKSECLVQTVWRYSEMKLGKISTILDFVKNNFHHPQFPDNSLEAFCFAYVLSAIHALISQTA